MYISFNKFNQLKITNMFITDAKLVSSSIHRLMKNVQNLAYSEPLI